MVKAIVRNWFGLVVDNNAGPNGFVYTVAEKVAFFYADDSLIASDNPFWLQWVFEYLISLFEWVGTIMNVA